MMQNIPFSDTKQEDMILYSDDMHSDTVYDTIDSYMYEGDGIIHSVDSGII